MPDYILEDNPFVFVHILLALSAIAYTHHLLRSNIAPPRMLLSYCATSILSLLALHFDAATHSLQTFGVFIPWAWAVWLTCSYTSNNTTPLTRPLALLCFSYIGYWLQDLCGSVWLEVASRYTSPTSSPFWTQILPQPHSTYVPLMPHGWFWWIGGAGYFDALFIFPVCTSICLQIGSTLQNICRSTRYTHCLLCKQLMPHAKKPPQSPGPARSRRPRY